MKRIVVATANAGKMTEIGEIMAGLPWILTSLKDHWDPIPDIPETGNSFLENARLKADWVFERCEGVWALADDSGLEVDALGGQPGVLSARYAGSGHDPAANNRKLLENLTGVPHERRTARFRCVVALKTAHNKYHIAEGACEGVIGFEPRGNGGFGYDPLFIPRGFSATFAELSSPEKHGISHRGQALRKLREELS